jgi:hypothetical protein
VLLDERMAAFFRRRMPAFYLIGIKASCVRVTPSVSSDMPQQRSLGRQREKKRGEGERGRELQREKERGRERQIEPQRERERERVRRGLPRSSQTSPSKERRRERGRRERVRE